MNVSDAHTSSTALASVSMLSSIRRRSSVALSVFSGRFHLAVVGGSGKVFIVNTSQKVLATLPDAASIAGALIISINSMTHVWHRVKNFLSNRPVVPSATHETAFAKAFSGAFPVGLRTVFGERATRILGVTLSALKCYCARPIAHNARIREGALPPNFHSRM